MNSKILIRMNLLNNSFEKFMNYQDKEYSILIKYLILDFKSFFVNMVMWLYGACRQAVKTSDCGSDMHGFESHQAPHLQFVARKSHFLLIYLAFQGF